jgi:hypothetical protein
MLGGLLGGWRTILFNIAPRPLRHGGVRQLLRGKLVDVALDEEEMQRALRAIEGLPAPV